MKLRTKLGWIVIFFLILINTGCIPIISTDFSANIGLGEKWSLVITIVPTPGFEKDLISQLNERYVGNQNFLSLGIQSKVEVLQPSPDGNTPIKLSIKGTGYGNFNLALDEQAIAPAESNGKRILYFDSNALGQITSNSSTFTLSGGEILTHNGTLVDSNTVTWNNPTDRMQATMAEPSLLDYWLYIAIGGLCLLGLASITLLFLGLRRGRKPAKIKYKHPSLLTDKICWNCGTKLPDHADFCSMCGEEQNQNYGGKQ